MMPLLHILQQSVADALSYAGPLFDGKQHLIETSSPQRQRIEEVFHRVLAACIPAAPMQVSYALLPDVDLASNPGSISLEELVSLLSFVDYAGVLRVLVSQKFWLLKSLSTLESFSIFKDSTTSRRLTVSKLLTELCH